jgi:inner membrane protein
MDTLTHVALGSLIGDSLLGKKIGKKAMAIGAFAQYFPDVDVIASIWLPPAQNLLAHRGITHSFFFAALAAGLFAVMCFHFLKRSNVTLLAWMLFFLLQLAIHAAIDAFNAYGVGWFEPFSEHRISFNTIYVVDPLLTLPVVAGSIVLLLVKNNYVHRLKLNAVSLILFALYLSYGTINKISVNSEVEEKLKAQHIPYNRYFTTPTPMNTWLWYVVAEDTAGYYTGYRSVFDTSIEMPLHYFLKKDSLLSSANDKDAIPYLKRFSQDYYTVEYRNQKLVFNDLRFGQIAGWQHPQAPFVFYYYLDDPNENLMVIQRGRVAGWNTETFHSLKERIKGI